MRALVWFRADLRLDDNPALAQACAAADAGVVAVYAVCPGQWQAHELGGPKIAFLLAHLRSLSAALAAQNIALRLVEVPTFAQVPAELLRLADEQGCDALYWNREYEVNERRRDVAVRTTFEATGRVVHESDDPCIVPPDALRTRQGGFYSVFTPFKRAWYAYLQTRGPGELHAAPGRQPAMVGSPDRIPATVAGYESARARADLWPVGESAAHRRLHQFIAKHLAAYAAERDYPAAPATSQLSPYLAAGVISPRRCLHAVWPALTDAGSAGDVRGPDTWLSELIWRDFYRHVLVGHPHVCMGHAFRRVTDELPWRTDEMQFEAWCAGRTGVPLVDAGMRQLAATGWMHNRVRMVVAMYLTKNLFIDWRWGERHFMRHLVDADFASNNGGWQWAASTGTDAAPYFRVFNPFSQAQKFDPDGSYIRAWVPELRDVPAGILHAPRRLDAATRAACGYSALICDHDAGRLHAIAAFKALQARR